MRHAETSSALGAEHLSQAPTGNQRLTPLSRNVRDTTLEYLESAKTPKKKIEAYIATGRQKHGERRVCPRGPLPQGATRLERMKRKLQTKAGAGIYAARKAIVEPVFGQIKQVRGFRQVSLRGLAKVKAEWALVCLTHNILKLHRLGYG